MQNLYRLSGPPPAQQGDYIKLGANLYFYLVKVEPLYYEYAPAPLITGIATIPDLVPSKDTIHYITGLGIANWGVKAQMRYQTGNPLNTVGARGTQRLDFIQAPYDKPFQTKIAVISGDGFELDIATPLGLPILGSIWFYGWKFKVIAKTEAPARYITLEDVRNITV